MSPAYIKDWNDSWSEGAIRFASKSQVEKYGTIGSNEAFMIPKTVFDNLLKESNGNLAYIEKKLSLSDGYLSSNSTGAYLIKQQDGFEVKLPTGNEGGANVQWLPGGKTLNGTREGILDLKNSGLKFEEVS